MDGQTVAEYWDELIGVDSISDEERQRRIQSGRAFVGQLDHQIHVRRRQEVMWGADWLVSLTGNLSHSCPWCRLIKAERLAELHPDIPAERRDP